MLNDGNYYGEIRGNKKAPRSVGRIGKSKYQENIETNFENLVTRMKKQACKPTIMVLPQHNNTGKALRAN